MATDVFKSVPCWLNTVNKKELKTSFLYRNVGLVSLNLWPLVLTAVANCKTFFCILQETKFLTILNIENKSVCKYITYSLSRPKTRFNLCYHF